MEYQLVTGLPQPYICQYPFIHLIGERHLGNEVTWPRTHSIHWRQPVLESWQLDAGLNALWGHCPSHLLILRYAFNFLFYFLLDFENKLKWKVQYGDADEVSRISPKDLTKCNSNALFMAMKVRDCSKIFVSIVCPSFALHLSWVQIVKQL